MFWTPSIKFAWVDPAELSQVRPGDKLKLWTTPDYEWINAYRPGSVGGVGKVGTLSKTENRKVAAALAEGVPVWLEVLSISGTKVSLGAKFESHEEVAAEKSSASCRLKTELLKPLRKLEPMSIELRAPEGFEFKVGQRYAIDIPPIDEYLLKPPSDVSLISPDEVRIRAIPPAPQRRLLLRAHFGDLTVHMLVVAMASEPAYVGDRTGVWKEAAATARVVMVKRSNP